MGEGGRGKLLGTSAKDVAIPLPSATTITSKSQKDVSNGRFSAKRAVRKLRGGYYKERGPKGAGEDGRVRCRGEGREEKL